MEINNFGFVGGIYGANMNNTQSDKASAGDKVPESISNLISAAKNASNYEEIEDYIETAVDNGELEEIDTTTYRCGDYFVNDILRHNGENIAEISKKLTEKGIKIAPQYVDAVHKDDNTILITKIDGTGGKDIVPFSQGYGMLDDKAKSEAYKDIHRLLKAGLANTAMLRSDDEWFVTPESKKVVVPDWSSLRPVQTGEHTNILSKCYRTLFRK